MILSQIFKFKDRIIVDIVRYKLLLLIALNFNILN